MTREVERLGGVTLPEVVLLPPSSVKFREDLIWPVEALPTAEVGTLGVELAAVDAAAGALGPTAGRASSRSRGHAGGRCGGA